MARGRVTDVIEVSDSDSDAHEVPAPRRGSAGGRRTSSASSSSKANDASRHMRRPSEWAFLESSDEDGNGNDSDDFERPARSKKPAPKKAKKASSAKPKSKAKSPQAVAKRSTTPVKAKAKAKQPSKSRQYSESEEEEEEVDLRPRRVVQRHLFSDHLTVSELQAQEREMARLRALNVRSHGSSHDHAKASPKPSTTSAVAKSLPPSKPSKPSTATKKTTPIASPVRTGIGRTVLATTLARKQHLRERTPPASPVVKKKPVADSRSAKRRRSYSEEEEEEDEEEDEEEEEDEQQEQEEDDESDDFEYDIVEAKRAALRASLELAKRKNKSSRLGIKTVVHTPSPPPSPPPSPKTRSSSSKSKITKKKVVTPPRKPVAKSKQPDRKQRKVVPPPPSPPPLPRESRRKSGDGLLSDWLSVSELQAQEREWSRIQRDLKYHESITPVSPVVSKPKASTVPKPKESTVSASLDRTTRSSRRLRADSNSSSDVSLVDIVELSEDDDDEEDFEPPAPAPKKSSAKPKRTAQSKKKSSASSKPSALAVPRPPANTSSTSNVSTKPADVLTKPRTAAETVPHWTTWRAVSFKSAPDNLLPLPSLLPPFESTADRPLIEFDTNGDLNAKCQILPSFGKTKSFLLTSDPSKPVLSQDSMNERVMDLLETWNPRIKSCYERKCDAIVQEARCKTAEYVRLREEAIKSILDRTAPFDSQMQLEKLPVCPAEQSLAKQLSSAKEISPLNVVGSIKVGRGETFMVEKEIVPHKAIELTPIRQISRSTTYTGIKASVRVEDDPILRYVPYFGDNDDGDAIDVKAYDAVRAKESAEGAKSANGLDNEIHEYILRLVIAEYGDLETVFNALKQVVGFGQPYTEYCEIKKRLDARLAARGRMEEIREYMMATKKGDGDEVDISTQIALKELTKDLYPFAEPGRAIVPLAERLASHWTYFDTNLLPSQSRGTKGFRRLLGLRHTTDYADLSETFRDLFCRMCYKYDCPDHGIEHPMPTRRVDPIYPVTRFAPLMTKGSKDAEEPKDAKCIKKQEASVEFENGEQKSIAKSDTQTLEIEESGSGEAAPVADITDLASECSATTAESQETIDLSLAEPRRSSRSGTRASTLAQISIESQLIAQGFKSRVQRMQRAKVPQKRVNEDESEYLDDSHKALVSSKVKKFLKAGETCSESCWKAENTSEEKRTAGTDEFTEPEEEIKSRLNAAELLILQKLRYTVGDNACMVASVLQSLSCRDIHTYLVSQQRSKPTDEQGYFSPDVSGKKNNRKRGRAAAALPGNNRELLKRTRHQRLKDTASANHDYEPCNHEGICDFGASCSCMKRDHMCEKACSCSRDCPNRFQGCKCSMGNCRTNQCPCFVALRECNPDLCHSCGASDVPVLVYNPEFKAVSSQDLGICCNVNVQRGLHKRIGVSYSRTHGWGSFALEPIKKGEFIYEYVGAIISHDEAERRGSIYDKLNISFLFDLNEDSVADAIRTGNKSKFCNHANVGQKCHARIFRVGGEHHISIWALADIRKGEELFFNYGYHGESAPVWSQGARITESSKREAEAAAATDDDAQPEIVTIE